MQTSIFGHPLNLNVEDVRASVFPFSSFKALILDKLPAKSYASYKFPKQMVWTDMGKFMTSLGRKFESLQDRILKIREYMMHEFLPKMREVALVAEFDDIMGVQKETEAQRIERENLDDFFALAEFMQGHKGTIEELVRDFERSKSAPVSFKNRNTVFKEPKLEYVGGNGKNNMVRFLRAMVTKLNLNPNTPLAVNMREEVSIKGSAYVEDVVITLYDMARGVNGERVGKSLSIQFKRKEDDVMRKAAAEKAGLKRNWINVNADNMMTFMLDFPKAVDKWIAKNAPATGN